tara:strand:- start:57 stop:536 length:480 start_codon:yes stop_codon:yes gene_type:complete
MAEYRNRDTGEIKTGGQVKKLHRNVSFSSMTDTFADLNWDYIAPVIRPKPTGTFRIVNRNGAEQDANGNWVQAWVERDMFATDDDSTKAEKETEYQDGLNATAAASARTDRDSRLALTDFHGLTDNTMSAEMTTYRQALRDVPEQDGFPNTINWPVEPS